MPPKDHDCDSVPIPEGTLYSDASGEEFARIKAIQDRKVMEGKILETDLDVSKYPGYFDDDGHYVLPKEYDYDRSE